MKKRNHHSIDYWRQLDLFSPHTFEMPIHIIGVGATGSYIAYLLAKMGCKDITVYDPDIVENHNLPNQIFGLDDIDNSKVASLGKIIKRDCGFDIKGFQKKVKKPKLNGIVFLLTDTMLSRKEIWLNSIKGNKDIQFLVETRMGAEFGRIFCLNPMTDINEYEKTLYSDEESKESPCTRRAIAPTVSTIAGMATYSLISWLNKENPPHDTIVQLSPPMIIAKSWNTNVKAKRLNKTISANEVGEIKGKINK